MCKEKISTLLLEGVFASVSFFIVFFQISHFLLLLMQPLLFCFIFATCISMLAHRDCFFAVCLPFLIVLALLKQVAQVFL